MLAYGGSGPEYWVLDSCFSRMAETSHNTKNLMLNDAGNCFDDVPRDFSLHNTPCTNTFNCSRNSSFTSSDTAFLTWSMPGLCRRPHESARSRSSTAPCTPTLVLKVVSSRDFCRSLDYVSSPLPAYLGAFSVVIISSAQSARRRLQWFTHAAATDASQGCDDDITRQVYQPADKQRAHGPSRDDSSLQLTVSGIPRIWSTARPLPAMNAFK